MVRLLAILAAALALPLAAGNVFAQAAYVHEMRGSVTATVDSATRPLKPGDILSTGTVVSTGDKSRAVIKFEDGQIMALSERSSFRIVEYRYVKERVRDSNMVFALLQGGLRFVTGMIGATNRNAFRLTAGTATIGIRGTDVSVVYDPATQSLVASVSVGEATIGTESIGPGQVFGTLSPAILQVLEFLATQGLPVNLPVSVPASAAAAAAAAEAARLAALADAQPDKPELRTAANAAADAAQKALAAALAAAAEAYWQAIQGGGVRPDGAAGLDGGAPAAGGSVGSGGSVSPN